MSFIVPLLPHNAISSNIKVIWFRITQPHCHMVYICIEWSKPSSHRRNWAWTTL